MAAVNNQGVEFPPIQQRLMDFIRREFRPGYNHYNVSKLIGDASARQYYRYVAESGRSFILAAYPEPFDPKQFSYQEVYELFRKVELPVPEILALDGKLGIVLQEDLGNESLQRRLLSASEEERFNHLCQAIDHILTIQFKGTKVVRPESQAYKLAFDEEKLNWELHFFRRNYLLAYRKLALREENLLKEEFALLSAELAHLPRFLCHRDYHVRNLMLKDDHLYIIDFQDARWGPPCYDLVSLLKDSIELETPEIRRLQEYYLERASAKLPAGALQDFERQFHLMSIQRLLKALGTYGYQIVSRGHFIYEQYIQGSLHRALLSLRSLSEFPYIREIVEKELVS